MKHGMFILYSGILHRESCAACGGVRKMLSTTEIFVIPHQHGQHTIRRVIVALAVLFLTALPSIRLDMPTPVAY